MKKIFSLLAVFLCCFMVQTYAQDDNGDQGIQAAYGNEGAYDAGSQGGDCCAPAQQADRPVGDCYCLMCHNCPEYYNVWHCEQVPCYSYRKCCRMVPQYYEKQCCRMVPQYYCKTCCRQVPQYYCVRECHYKPKYTCEKRCRMVPKYYYKHTCQQQQACCAPAPAAQPCCPAPAAQPCCPSEGNNG